jgi:hypothetical protein
VLQHVGQVLLGLLQGHALNGLCGLVCVLIRTNA